MALLDKHPTYTGTVYEYLCGLDDMATTAMICAATRVSAKHASTALVMLEEYRAVERVSDGHRDWWFATPKQDRRVRVLKETTTHTRRTRGRMIMPRDTCGKEIT